MSKPSLFAFARDNDPEYPTRLEPKLSPLQPAHSAQAAAFRSVVETLGTVSINMSAKKFCKFMSRGRYLSMQGDAVANESEEGTSKDATLARQREYLAPRLAFEGHFEDGEQFLYGALNIGGVGPPDYGIFCTVIEPSVVHALPCAFVPGDSLSLYAMGKVTVDEAAVQNDAATPASRGILATIKHLDDLEHKDDSAWPEMLCSNECFVEAIFVGEVNPASVREVRIAKAEYRRMAKLIIREKQGDLKEREEIESMTARLRLFANDRPAAELHWAHFMTEMNIRHVVQSLLISWGALARDLGKKNEFEMRIRKVFDQASCNSIIDAIVKIPELPPDDFGYDGGDDIPF